MAQEAEALLAEARGLIYNEHGEEGHPSSHGLLVALRAVVKARVLWKQLGREDQEAAALILTADIHVRRTSGAEAIEAANVALSIVRARGDRPGEAQSLHFLSAGHALVGTLHDAVSTGEAAVSIFGELREWQLEAFELASIGRFYLDSKPQKAIHYSDDALELFLERGAGGSREVFASATSTRAHIRMGNHQSALSVAKQAAKRFRQAADCKSEADALLLVSEAYIADSDADMALIAAQKAAKLFKKAGEPHGEMKALCATSGLLLRDGDDAGAKDAAAEAMSLAKDLEAWDDAVEALKCIVAVHVECGDPADAVKVASKVRLSLEQSGDVRAERAAFLVLCKAHSACQQFDKAATAARAVQELAVQDDSLEWEAKALDMLADTYMKDSKFDKAIRAAEQAKRLWKRLGRAEEEASATLLSAQARVNQMNSQESLASAESFERALQDASAALQAFRGLGEDCHNKGKHMARTLSLLSQLHLQVSRSQEAFEESSEALELLTLAGDEQGAAYAWCLRAHAELLLERFQQSKEDASAALSVFQLYEDNHGEQFARDILAKVEASMPKPDVQKMAPAWGSFPAGWEPPAPKPSVAVVAERAKEPVVEKIVRAPRQQGDKLEITLSIIGDDEEVLEADLPLMQAGLTSNTAVLLRDELMEELPGVNLPPTLIFDYPSVAAIADFVCEKAQTMS